MPTSGDETQERSIRLEIIRLIIVGWFLIHTFGFGFFAVTSAWHVFSLSRQSSISTSMSTRVMIAQQWSLGLAWIKSSSIWIHTMCLHVKEFGDCLGLTCMRSFQTLSIFRSTSHNIKQSPGFAEIAGNWWNNRERGIPSLLHTSKPMQIHLFHMHETSSIKTSLPNLYGWTSNTDGKQELRGLLLVTCYMSMQIQESTSMFMYFSQQSKVLRHLRISVL